MKWLEAQVAVSGQIMPDEVAGLAARGFALIINNRPDGEEMDQPAGAEIAAAAETAGIAYCFIPVAQLEGEAVARMEAALAGETGKILAFCRSGTRSTYLWALARSGQGAGADNLVAAADAAGYDLTPIRRFLR